jgi:hypothetical protein
MIMQSNGRNLLNDKMYFMIMSTGVPIKVIWENSILEMNQLCAPPCNKFHYFYGGARGFEAFSLAPSDRCSVVLPISLPSCSAHIIAHITPYLETWLNSVRFTKLLN